MRGSISKYEGPRGTAYRLRVDLGIIGGKRKQLERAFKGKAREAKDALDDLMAEARAGTLAATPPISVKDMFTAFLMSMQAQVRPSTWSIYKIQADRYISRHIGHWKLREIDAYQIEALYGQLARTGGKDGNGLSAQTIHHIHRLLSHALSWCVRRRWLGRNPCEDVKPPKVNKPEIRVLRPDQAPALFSYLQQHSPWAYAPTALALLTGMRRSELLGLQWGDVYLDGANSSLSIRRGVTFEESTKRVVVLPPKTTRSARSVELSPLAVNLLRAHREAKEQEAKIIGRVVQDSDFIFAFPEADQSRPEALPRPHSLSRAFERACKAAEVKVSFHGLRHTHATEMLKSNVHPAVVANRLGHSSIAITVDTYSSVLPGMQRKAAQAFDAGWSSAIPALSAGRPD